MTCRCPQLEEFVEVDAYATLLADFDQKDIGNWVRLWRCRVCGQHWRVTDQDGREPRFATKITDAARWKEFGNAELEKQFLIQSRGGLSDQPCAWAGCVQPHVNGVAYCVDHLYQSGARR